jgi:hypothetical protein
VVVGSTNEHHRLTCPPKISDIKIGWYIGPEVTKVTGAVGIGKPAGHEDGSITHHYLFDDDAINKVITMGKRFSLLTRSFGSDPPLLEPLMVSHWISERRGREGDLTSFLLEQGINLQIKARLSMPCAGGMLYRDRWKDAFTGLTGQVITGELGASYHDIGRDAGDLAVISKGLWIAVPAPHQLGFDDRYYGDREEADHALYSEYKSLMREQRDAGISGHVLLCETVRREELESLGGKRVFFFSPNLNRKTLSVLLEYQPEVALNPRNLSLITDLMGEYEVHRIVLLDPEEQDLRQALQIKDPDQILCGGYCHTSCEDYWKNLVEKSSILK